MTEQLDILLALAEVSIALAGFAAIVVVLKRRGSGAWHAEDADHFNGMITHAACAVAFCLLPILVDMVVQDSVLTLHILVGLLGVQIVAHTVGVMLMRTTGRLGIFSMLLGLCIGLLQFTAFTDWGVHRELQIFSAGIVWHILQAGMLFVMLVFIPADARE